jgi:hypothetical protein
MLEFAKYMVTAHPPSLRRGTQADAHGPQHVCSSTFFIDAKLYQKAKHPIPSQII